MLLKSHFLLVKVHVWDRGPRIACEGNCLLGEKIYFALSLRVIMKPNVLLVNVHKLDRKPRSGCKTKVCFHEHLCIGQKTLADLVKPTFLLVSVHVLLERVLELFVKTTSFVSEGMHALDGGHSRACETIFFVNIHVLDKDYMYGCETNFLVRETSMYLAEF